MAQHYVGSNNLPLLAAAGQFGTRLQGGEDAASPRYIFTHLTKVARLLIPESDDALLEQQEEDGVSIEPLRFVPILPLVLINGAEGIGTGWATSIPQFNPLDVVDHVVAAVTASPPPPPLFPWYAGFRGTIESDPAQSGATTHGVVEVVSEGKVQDNQRWGLVVRVTELPIGRWTNDFKDLLIKLSEASRMDGECSVASFSLNHTESTVDCRVELTSEGARLVGKDEGGDKAPGLPTAEALRKLLKLSTKLSMGNMMAFNSKGSIQRYSRAEEIVADFVGVRRDLYQRRKAREEELLRLESTKLENQIRFLEMVGQGTLKVGGKSKPDLESELGSLKFATGDALRYRPPLTETAAAPSGMPEGQDEAAEEEGGGTGAESASQGQYGYLLSMPIWSATQERCAKLRGMNV
ncbi:DNA topoisomerase [Baffinella frigidus]|nr:DNA topoisomerase [Cryptophyta sp. CCMP2293]